MPSLLNTKQTDLLRYLCRQAGPVPVDHLDGRIMRALQSRGYVSVSKTWASPTPSGRTYLTRADDAPRRGAEPDGSPRAARAQTILRAVTELERALPIDAEVQVGTMPAYADDVLEALRRYAREM